MNSLIILMVLAVIVVCFFLLFFKYINKKNTVPSDDGKIKNDHCFLDEKWLRVIADITLVVGIIATVASFLYLMPSNSSIYGPDGEMVKNYISFEGLLFLFGGIFSSFLIWSFLRVISNISISLKKLIRK